MDIVFLESVYAAKTIKEMIVLRLIFNKFHKLSLNFIKFKIIIQKNEFFLKLKL